MCQQFLDQMLDEIRTNIQEDSSEGMKQLILYLFHEDWNIRKSASQIFSDGGVEAHEFLLNQISAESDQERKQTLCYWLTTIIREQSGISVKLIENLFQSGNHHIRKMVLDNNPNLEREEFTSFLYQLLANDNWEIRERASRNLITMSEKVVPFIENKFINGNDHQRFWTFKILAKILGSSAVKYFSKFIKEVPDDEKISLYAVSNLGEIDDPRVIKSLLNFLKTDSFLIREQVFRSLCKVAINHKNDVIKLLKSKLDGLALETMLRVAANCYGHEVVSDLSELFESSDAQSRYLAVIHLGSFKSQETARILIRRFIDERYAIRKVAMEKLSQLQTYAISPLLETLKSTEKDLVYWALNSLGAIAEPTTLSSISTLLHSEDKELRLLALETISQINTEECCEIFIEAFDNDRWEVRQRASELFVECSQYPIVYLLIGSCSQNQNILFWSLKTLERMELIGAEAFIDQITQGFDSPQLYLRNLKLADQNILCQQLRKKNPVLFKIEQSINENASQTGSSRAINVGIDQQNTVAAQNASNYQTDITSLPDTSDSEHYPVDLNTLLEQAFNLEASDIHLKVGHPPIIRVNGKLSSMRESEINNEHVVIFAKQILKDKHLDRLERNFQVDTSYQTEVGTRLRINIYKTLVGYELAGRFISDKVPTFESLRLPTSVMQRISTLENGLVILTGPTGSGKSSTLASMINYINVLAHKHIICIEDPVEYLHTSKLSYISQREVLRDVSSFPSGIRATLREDPDVILIGELRDEESVETAITLAGTGHLVLTTLHAPTCTSAVEQLMDFFSAEHQEHIRKQIAFNLKAIVSQRLLRRKTGGGRIPACEIMINTPAVKNIIRDGKTEQLPTMIETSKKDGMISLDQTLKDLIHTGQITLEEAWPHVIDQKTFRPQ
ncbi:MAG: PilT/PilU family type 4a pilus ATPase [bacterium]|nr:PilT/PilU family type 4a pilus ATPase [bacterium]